MSLKNFPVTFKMSVFDNCDLKSFSENEMFKDAFENILYKVCEYENAIVRFLDLFELYKECQLNLNKQLQHLHEDFAHGSYEYSIFGNDQKFREFIFDYDETKKLRNIEMGRIRTILMSLVDLSELVHSKIIDFMKECIREISSLKTTQLYFGLILSLNPKLWDALAHVKKDYIDHRLINTGVRLTDESQEILKSFMLLCSRRSQINAYL